MKLNSFFFKGVMNKSVDERILPAGEYVDALNARLGSTEDSEIGALENTKGNTKLTNITNQGVNLSENAVCIGSYADDNSQTIFWFITDPGSADLIVSFNTKTNNTVYHIISNTVLNFNPSYLITGVELIDRFLIFTDNLNPPRKINIDRNYPFPSGGIDQITDEEINLIVKPPLHPPTFTLSSTDTDDNSFMTDKFVSFAYRFRYEDGEYSSLSPFSLPAFEPLQPPVDVNLNQVKNDSMINAYSGATVFFNTGSDLVKDIELCYKESSSTVIKVIDRYNKQDLGWADNTNQSIFFKNKEVFSVLSANESLRLYDNVPLKAKALTKSGNRLMLGNYVDGFDMKDSSGQDVKLNFQTSLVNTKQDTEIFEGQFLSSDYQVLNGSSSPSTISVDNSKAVFDFGTTQFIQGDFVTFNASFRSLSSGANIYDQDTARLELTRSRDLNYTISSTLQLTSTYSNLGDFVTSQDFENLIGTGLATATPEYQPFSTASSGSTATDFNNINLLTNPATNDTTSSSVTAVNSAVPNAAAALSSPVPPAYPTGQTGFLETYDATTPSELSIQALMAVYEVSNKRSFEGFEFTSANFTIEKNSLESLHSNRDYDIGMIYMDDYGRSSTAQVSLNNSINVPAGNSVLINKAQVNIPISQKAPEWATHYKFAIKPSKLTYDTIYLFRATPDLDDDSEFWCLLEGETAQKISEGESYVVKRDIDGPLTTYIETTCLAKSTTPNVDTAAADYPGPGVYAKFAPGNDYRLDDPDIQKEKNDVKEKTNLPFASIEAELNASGFTQKTIPEGTTVKIEITCEREKPKGVIGDVANITSNSDEFKSKFSKLTATRVANQDYNTSSTNLSTNLEEMVQAQFVNSNNFFANQDTDFTENDGVKYKFKLTSKSITSGDTEIIAPAQEPAGADEYFHEVSFTTALSDSFGAFNSFPALTDVGVGASGTNKIKIKLTISNVPDGLAVLETDGEDAPDEIYYEGNEVFEINGDFHTGNTQDQNYWQFYDNAQNNAYRSSQSLPASTYYGGNLALTTTGGSGDAAPFKVGDIVNVLQTNTSPTNPQYNGQHTVLEKPDAQTIVLDVAFGSATGVEGGEVDADAIVLTNFFNCYSFGVESGIESCKIYDSFKEDAVNIGERVYTLALSEFKQTRRGASITYSGVYNDETKLNRLNEFNLGILNFKDLDEEFGEIQLLRSRQTDLLVLQEDKISYVLVNKSLLTSGDGLSNVTSTPTILGNQVARLEEYGISKNPESYAEFGYDKYFTDVKRGAVIKLTGSSYSNDSLSVISEFGMRSYFRDLFIEDSETQKIGGFDPYMNEYVLSSNDKTLPVVEEVYGCGSELEFINQMESFTYTVNLGGSMGTTDINYNVTSGTINISVTYDGTTSSSGDVTGSGVFQFDKNKPAVETASVTINVVGVSADYSITTNCPDADIINVYQICINSDFVGIAPSIHNQYSWSSALASSPLISQPVTFTNTATGSGTGALNVAQYQVYTSQVAIGTSPTPTARVSVKSAKIGNDTFDFDSTQGNRLRYLLSGTVYDNNQTDLNALLLASNTLTISNTSRGIFEGSFNYSNTSSSPLQNLYIIYDYRTSTSVSLEFGASESTVCDGLGALGTYYLDAVIPSEATAIYTDESLTTAAADGYYLYVNPNPTITDTYWLQQSGGVIVDVDFCSS